MVELSIILCTYNPKIEVLKKCLEALSNQTIKQDRIEGIIVDNNSTKPVKELNIVKAFLKNNPSFRVIREEKPGLSNARIAGYRASKSNLIAFVDDDNAPFPNYFEIIIQKFNKNERLGALGPGKINVEFIGDVQNWVTKFKSSFQEIQIQGQLIDNNIKWQKFYPRGTGLSIRRAVFDHYMEFLDGKENIITGRIGKYLASGEDTQLIWCGILKGYFAGIDGELELDHLISRDKANLTYMKRVAFGVASSYWPLYIDLFPEKLKTRKLLPDKIILKEIVRYLISKEGNILTKRGVINSSRYLGKIVGNYKVNEKDIPKSIQFLIKLLNIN
ncbi:MAG: glycosyltransferase family 2 protein [Chitinophagales bacterium]